MGLYLREPKEVYVDNAYNPCIRSHQVERIGSASDRARLVLAYVLALLRVSVRGGHHPGFVVLDEPLQQNPDPLHRGMAVELLQKRWPRKTDRFLYLRTCNLSNLSDCGPLVPH